MSVKHINEMKEVVYNSNGAQAVHKKSMIGPWNGWEEYVMRFFEIEPGGYTPKHQHPWPQYMFVMEGDGLIDWGEQEEKLQFGHSIVVPDNALHQIKNVGDRPLRFICVVPPRGDL